MQVERLGLGASRRPFVELMPLIFPCKENSCFCQLRYVSGTFEIEIEKRYLYILLVPGGGIRAPSNIAHVRAIEACPLAVIPRSHYNLIKGLARVVFLRSSVCIPRAPIVLC